MQKARVQGLFFQKNSSSARIPLRRLPILNNKKAAEAAFFASKMFGLAFEHVAEFLVEFVHATGTVDDFLLAGIKRMAFRANLDRKSVFFHSGLGGEFVAARAGNGNFVVVRVDTLFHDVSFRLSGYRDFAYTSRQALYCCSFFLFCQVSIVSGGLRIEGLPGLHGAAASFFAPNPQMCCC